MPNRSDIRSDTSDGSVQDGIPLRLILHVYDVDDNGSCTSLSDAKVDMVESIIDWIRILGYDCKSGLDITSVSYTQRTRRICII